MHVLVATDGSEVAIDAARRALPLLNADMKVTLLSVVEDALVDSGAGGIEGPVLTPEQEAEVQESETEYGAQSLAETEAALRASLPEGATVDRRIETGEPAAAICQVARDLGVDLVVVGSHGKRFMKRVLLGSVSEHVIRHAPCPVLVVHAQQPKDG